MTLTLDKAGRIVVPKPLRDRLGLRAGMKLEVTESPEGLVLKPASEKPAMLLEDGFWVHQGVAPKGFDWDKFIEEQREERHRKVSGL
jgi:AbrB family looped-hinge helix DNA binding protein